MTQRVEVICEVGSNYDGDLETALKYVTAAAEAGADVVKFQTLRRDTLVAPNVERGGRWVDNPIYANFANLELPDEWHFELKAKADSGGIEFMSTPFHVEAVGFLERVGVRRYKIASGDITFRPLREAVGATGKHGILSTGASSMADVDAAVTTLKKVGAGPVSLLHCVANYPPRWNEMNLRAIPSLCERFGLPVGISDHTAGSVVPVAAVALGASVVEKHMTFDRSRPGPDHAYALTVEEFGNMVNAVRHVEAALGSGVKEPTPAEQLKQERIRRGVYDPDSLLPVEGGDGLWLRPEHHGGRPG